MVRVKEDGNIPEGNVMPSETTPEAVNTIPNSAYDFIDQDKKKAFDSASDRSKKCNKNLITQLPFWDQLFALEDIGLVDDARDVLGTSFEDVSTDRFREFFYDGGKLSLNRFVLLNQLLKYHRFEFNDVCDDNSRTIYELAISLINRGDGTNNIQDDLKQKIYLTIDDTLRSLSAPPSTQEAIEQSVDRHTNNETLIRTATTYAQNEKYGGTLIHIISGTLSKAEDRYQRKEYKNASDLLDALCVNVSELPELRQLVEEEVIPLYVRLGEAENVPRIAQRLGLTTPEDEEAYNLFGTIIGGQDD